MCISRLNRAAQVGEPAFRGLPLPIAWPPIGIGDRPHARVFAPGDAFLQPPAEPGGDFEDGEGRRWTPAAAPPAWRGGFPMGGGRVVAAAALGERSPHDWTPVAYASYLAPQNVPILPPRPSFQFAGGAVVEPVSPIAPPRGRAPYQFRAAAPPDPRLRRVGAPLEPASPKRAAVEGGGWVAPRRFARPPELAPARAPRPSQSDALDEPEPLEQPPLSAAGPHRIVHGVLGLAKAPTFDRGRAVAALRHLADAALAGRRPSLLQHVLYLHEALGAPFDADAAVDAAMSPSTPAAPPPRAGAPPFPPTVHGVSTRACPVLAMTVARGRLVGCEANDVFKANVAASILDDDSVFDVLEKLVDADDLPRFYDALAALYGGAREVTPLLRCSPDVQHNVGWLAYEARPATARVRVRLDLADGGAAATYALCMLPAKLAAPPPEAPELWGGRGREVTHI